MEEFNQNALTCFQEAANCVIGYVDRSLVVKLLSVYASQHFKEANVIHVHDSQNNFHVFRNFRDINLHLVYMYGRSCNKIID